MKCDVGCLLSVLGCADIVQPPHAWLRRTGDELVVGCNGANQQWHLTCQHNHWQGVIGNCSQCT